MLHYKPTSEKEKNNFPGFDTRLDTLNAITYHQELTLTKQRNKQLKQTKTQNN